MDTNNMNYCMECGAKLVLKMLKEEGEIPYCKSCGEYKYPIFSTACSMIVMNPDQSKIPDCIPDFVAAH